MQALNEWYLNQKGFQIGARYQDRYFYDGEDAVLWVKFKELFDFYNFPLGCPNLVLVDHVCELLPHVCTFNDWIIVSVKFNFFLLSVGWRQIHARTKTLQYASSTW